MMTVGQKVRLDYEADRWYTIQAADERFAIGTRGRKEIRYTILDFEENVRGSCNLIGGGWDFSLDTLQSDAEKLLRALNYQLEVSARLRAGERSVTLEEDCVEVSYRNRVTLRVLEVTA